VRALPIAVALSCGMASFSGSAQQAGRCEASKADFAVGQPYSPELAERAQRAAAARDVRRLEPGGAATTDFREDRLNFHVGDQNTVRRVTCG
jgi:hypothetical protein